MDVNIDTTNWIPVEPNKAVQNNIDTTGWKPTNETLRVVKESPYTKQLEETPPPVKPTTFWQEVGRQLYSEPDEKNPTIAYQLIHPLVEGVKQGAKDIGEAVPQFLDSPLHSTLQALKGAGEIAFNVIPQAAAFSVATNAIKMAANQTPYGKEIGEALDIPFTLATKVANLAGYDPEKDSNGELALGILDIIAGGKLAHETMGTTKGGKLKDVNGEVVKDKEGNPIPIKVPTVAGQAIKSFKDLTGITEKAAKGELAPKQMKELADYLQSLKEITPKDIIKSAEDKILTIANADEAAAKLNPDQMSDKQKSDLLTDVVKTGNIETVRQNLQQLKDSGALSKEQADEGFIRLNSYEKYINHIKDKGLDNVAEKEATHKAWQLENDDYNIRAIESDPTHKEDPMKQADLVNFRDARKVKVKELADILANKPKEVDKEIVKESKQAPVFESEQDFLNKNWQDVRDELTAKLKRDPTAEEVFAETRKLYNEKNPVKEPSVVEKTDKLFEEQINNLTEKQNKEFNDFQDKESEFKVEPKVETKKEEPTPVKENAKVELNKNFEEVNVIPYDEIEKNKYKPDEQLKFNQGDYYEPVRIVAHPDLIKLIEMGNKRFKQRHKEINKVYEAKLEKELGMTSMDAYNKARELAKEHRSKTVENIIEFSKKKIEPTKEVVSKEEIKKELTSEEEKQEKLQSMPDDEFVNHFIDSGQFASVNDNGLRVTFSNDSRFESMQPNEITKALRDRHNGKETVGTKRLEKNILKAKELGVIPTIEGTGGKSKSVDRSLHELMDVKKKFTAKEQRDYNETIIREREQAEKDILKEEHIPKSEEKGFNSKFEQLISKKNRTKTETTEGDSTETGTFHLGDDVGYVEFQDGTKVNLATHEGKAVQMGKRLPKDGSKVTVEAKTASVERPFDRINVIGVDSNGKPIKGMLRRTNESSNILEKTGEKNNPGAYADPAKVGLSEKEQQEIIDKEAADLKEKPQQQKESSAINKNLIDKVVEKLQKALPKLEVVYDEKIKGAGQLDANGNTVRINPFKAGTDTPIHEYGHALIDIYGGIKNKLVAGAIERLKGTALWKEVESRYSELSQEMLAKEVLAEAIGREGKKIFEKESQQNWFKNFVDNFYYKIKKLLGLEKDQVKILAKQLLIGKELSKEIVATHEAQLQKLSEEDMFKQFADVYHKKSKIDKFKDRVTDVLNVPRALMTSLDMSAPFRQAVVLTLTHPIFAGRAAKEMFKQAFSQKAFDNWLIDMRNNKDYELMKDSGLYISDPHTTKLSAKEEHFMTNLAQKLPIIGSLVKGSERAYVSYLNKIRTDVFINAIAEFKEQGLTYEKNKDVYKAMAEFINNATGRGNLGKLEKSAQTLNTIFFSPRLIASRVRLLTNWSNPEWYAKTPKNVRIKEAKTMGAFIAIGSSILALAAAAGAKVQTNPTSSDFGKIQIGKTRLDVWGGFQQWVRVTAQILAGQKISASGKKIDLTKGRASRLDVAASFARGKLAPIPALGLELLQGRKITGEKLTAKGVALDNLVPLYIQDMQDAAKQEGGIGMLSVGIPAFFGVGTQTYDTNKK